MMNYTIKSYNGKTEKSKSEFYILNKGLNSGKPLNEPCPNCFTLKAENDFDRETLYWICYALWQTKVFEQRLVGSVIPFLRKHDLLWVLDEYIPKINDNPKLHKAIGVLHSFQVKANELKIYLLKTEQLKRSLLRHLIV